MLIIRRFAIVLLTISLLLTTGATAVLASPSHDDGPHIVQRGDTLSTIAKRYGVSIQAIMEANGISDPAVIFAGQILVIPGAGPILNQAQAGVTMHVVAAGETLSGIAKRYGITLASLAQANSVSNPSLIRAGQRLSIPGSRPIFQGQDPRAQADIPASPIANRASPSATVYTVKAGDSLGTIARRYNTTVGAIAAVNHLNDPSRIYPGQQLTITESSAPQVRPQNGLRMLVSIGQQRCWVYRGETLLYDWHCSTGRPGSGTKVGTFYVQSKIQDAWGSAWGFWMPYWLGIYWAGSTENGIHGLPYEPGGQPIWANSVGTPVTFGCVLLGAEESKTLWEMAYIGMPITIAY